MRLLAAACFHLLFLLNIVVKYINAKNCSAAASAASSWRQQF